MASKASGHGQTRSGMVPECACVMIAVHQVQLMHSSQVQEQAPNLPRVPDAGCSLPDGGVLASRGYNRLVPCLWRRRCVFHLGQLSVLQCFGCAEGPSDAAHVYGFSRNIKKMDTGSNVG